VSLKFYPRGRMYDAGPKYAGQMPNYLGRTTVKRDGYFAHPATGVCVTVDENSPTARKVRSFAYNDTTIVWPADEYTAKWLNIPYVPVALGDDGEFHPAPAPLQTRSKGK
jgi:hypothetical protein